MTKDAKAAIAQRPWDYPDKGALCKYYDKLVRKELDTESGLVLLLAVMKQLTPSIDISGVTLDDIKKFDADLAELEKLMQTTKTKTKNDLNDLINFFDKDIVAYEISQLEHKITLAKKRRLSRFGLVFFIIFIPFNII